MCNATFECLGTATGKDRTPVDPLPHASLSFSESRSPNPKPESLDPGAYT